VVPPAEREVRDQRQTLARSEVTIATQWFLQEKLKPFGIPICYKLAPTPNLSAKHMVAVNLRLGIDLLEAAKPL
jgi:hypothetical protein